MEKVSCASRIKLGMEKRGLKQSDLCSMTGISKSTMSQYINGLYEPSQVKIDIIAKALRVSEAWLMGYDVPMERAKPTTVSDDELCELERQLIALFRLLPEEDRDTVAGMIEGALKRKGLLK